MNGTHLRIWHTCHKQYLTALTVFTVIVCIMTAATLGLADCLSITDLMVTTAFFYILGIAGYAVLEWSDRHNLPHTSIFIALKFCKLLLSILFIVIRALISRNEMTTFALTFIGFYIVYLLFETLCLVRLEKSLRKDTK